MSSSLTPLTELLLWLRYLAIYIICGLSLDYAVSDTQHTTYCTHTVLEIHIHMHIHICSPVIISMRGQKDGKTYTQSQLELEHTFCYTAVLCSDSLSLSLCRPVCGCCAFTEVFKCEIIAVERSDIRRRWSTRRSCNN